MIRPLRRLHAALVPILAAIAAVLVGLALARRPAEPVNATWPAPLEAAAARPGARP